MLRCDFCGIESVAVSRVALDSGYDRLSEKHVKKYACAECALKKEESRKQTGSQAGDKSGAPDLSERS